MDTLRLQKFQWQSSLVEKQGSDKQFLEFFINNNPLSELLDKFYNSETTILKNWIGVLGSSVNSGVDIVKVKQLLGKKVSDKEIRQVYPVSWTDNEFQWYLEKYREELNNPEVLIYCCAECGDYDCGGIAVVIDRANNSVVWTIKEGDKALRFEFDKYLYFQVLEDYLRKIDK